MHENVHPVGTPVDVESQEILASGRGWCDQQANVFIQLARSVPLDGRLVFLHDATGESPHSIAEIYLDGAWRVVDPLLGVAIVNGEGRLATREDIAREPQLLADEPRLRMLTTFGSTTDFAAMARWYEHGPTIFNTWRGKRKTWFDQCPPWLRRRLLWVIQDVYLLSPMAGKGFSGSQRWLLRARHYELLGRSREAIRLYQRLMREANDATVKDDARFFLGQLYEAEGRAEEALATFQLALRESPSGKWTPFTRAALGRLYEQLGQPTLALQAYESSQLMQVEPLVGQRVMRLRAHRMPEGPS